MEVGPFINKLSDSIAKSSVLEAVISNPFTISLLFTAIAVIVIMAVFHIKPTAAAVARSSIYIYAITLLLMYLHQKSVFRAASEGSRTKDEQAVVGSVVASQRGGQSADDHVDVHAMLHGGGRAAASGVAPNLDELKIEDVKVGPRAV